MNDNIDEVLSAIKEEFSHDKTLAKRTRTQVKNCEPIFDNKQHSMMTAEQMKEEKVDEMMFVQVPFKVVQQQCNKRENGKIVNNQMNPCQGIKMFGDCALEAMSKESMQSHMLDSFIPCMKNLMMKED